ncbi:acylphosphatase [Roseburia sp. 499]|uniref:acylphosphatase n=1 Tax=Roseburia sp. 499 TaxID=1261634 RepID=UPI00130187E4|nr:acylphosphatase [Roseburia sp. 499]WVK69538.1 acylphosphatase [Roseburia sp. 499]
MIRERMIFTGRVQGVGFRYKVCYVARHHGMTGFARNEYDGSVTVEVQGTRAQIDDLIEILQHDNFIRIENILREEMELQEEKGFQIRG